jgi:hypothetical protein
MNRKNDLEILEKRLISSIIVQTSSATRANFQLMILDQLDARKKIHLLIIVLMIISNASFLLNDIWVIFW